MLVALGNVLALALVAATLKSALAGGPSMFGILPQAVAALVAIAAAAALAPSRRTRVRWTAISLAMGVGLFGLASILQASGLPIGVHGVPANAGLLFALLGFGIATGGRERLHWIADGLVIGAGVVAMYALIALLFGSTVQYPFAGSEPMTIATGILGLVLATGILLQRTDRGLARLATSDTNGGVLVRRLVPMLLIVPVVIARLTYLGVELGAYAPVVGISIGVMSGVAILLVVVIASARVVDRLDTVRRGNEAQIRQMVVDIARQSKELHRSNKELESFSYSVSHDLRAPIRHIAGFTELLARVGAQTLDAKTKHYIAMIAESANNAGKLIDDLLEFSRMGRAEIKKRDVPLAEVVAHAWARLAPERSGRSIELRIDELPTVSADPAMIEIVIGNLLSNAVKYTARRPDAVITVEAQTRDEDVEITVRDNGAGFDMKYVDKLFGVFQRLHGDEYEGVGIGLANVKRIVEKHGGRVWAEGEVDRGASFHLSLPRDKEVGA